MNINRTDTQSQPSNPVAQIIAGTKAYAGVNAIEGVNIALYGGEIHALVGENGAGKSTICKVISGAVKLDAGEFMLNGVSRMYQHPSEALADGVMMVYQETSLVPSMTVAQNLRLGHEPMFTQFRRLNTAARQQLQSLNFNVPVNSYVSAIGSAHKQMVEIAKALTRKAQIVIFDEPTATLSPEEKEQLFISMRSLARSGTAVVFVSHALEECLAIGDRVTVLRDGVVQITEEIGRLTRADLVRHMVGRNVEYIRHAPPADHKVADEPTLVVEGITFGTLLRGMSFSAYAGEVLGIAGLVGSGRTEVAHIIAGFVKRNRINGGRILLNGRPIRYRVPRQALHDGIVYVTEDRKVNGFFDTMSVSRNIYIGEVASSRWLPTWTQTRSERTIAARFVERFKIRATSTSVKVIELSGGNQQKVVLAKALTGSPKVIIFDEPTRGVDVGAIEEIHKLIRDAATSGATVILISSYLPEILAVSDRILVAQAGRIVAELPIQGATEESIMFAAVH